MPDPFSLPASWKISAGNGFNTSASMCMASRAFPQVLLLMDLILDLDSCCSQGIRIPVTPQLSHQGEAAGQQHHTPNANLLSTLAVVGLLAQGEGCSLLGEAARAVFPSHTPHLHLISLLSLHSTFPLLPAPILWAAVLGQMHVFQLFSFKSP